MGYFEILLTVPRGGLLDDVAALLKPVLCDGDGVGRRIMFASALLLSNPDSDPLMIVWCFRFLQRDVMSGLALG